MVIEDFDYEWTIGLFPFVVDKFRVKLNFSRVSLDKGINRVESS